MTKSSSANRTDATEKRYYTIREVAELLDLPLYTLRFWESRFTIIKPRRTATGRRMYTASDIEKIRMVYYLVRDKGLHLDAAQEQLRNNHTGVSRHSAAVSRLKEIRNELQSMLDALNSLR
jgi:DNA-binding transcriptional MerR regulator